MNSGIISINQIPQVVGNLALKESVITGTTYNSAIATAQSAGKLIQFPSGVVQTTEAVRTASGFRLTGVISNITASAQQVGAWLMKPAMVVVKAGLWAVGVAVASCLGLKIGSDVYNWIDENKPEAWVWLDEQLTAIGWRDFDFALSENGISYLPTAVVELYKSWFEYLGFFQSGGVDRTLTNTSLIVTDFSTVPFNDAFSEYLNLASFQKIIQMMGEAGLSFDARDYMVLGYESDYSIRMYYFKNVEQFRYNAIGSYSRADDGKLNNFVSYITCDESWYFNVSNWGDNYIEETSEKTEIEFRTRDKYASSIWLQDNLGTLVPSVEGVSKQDGAVFPSKNETVATTYPSWFDNKITITTPDKAIDFVPVAMPQVNPLVEDTVLPQTDAQTGVLPDTVPYVEQQIATGSQEAVESLTDAGVETPSNPPMDNIGSTPIIPNIPIDPHNMMSVYNPTVTEVGQFSEYLWTTDFVDNIKKLFLDPFQGIVGFFELYATPIISENKTEITIGWLGTNVNSYRVTDKFIDIDCGTVTPWEYFGNVLDFNPYTSVQLYLPFIGIVPLNPNHVIGSNVNIKYKIDVTTGTCVANIYMNNNLLYSFNGNCAVQVPLTGANYNAVVGGLLSIAGGTIATLASGGTLAIPSASAIVSGAMSAKTNLQQSGSLGANAGVLAPRKPYLIIERPIAYDALDYPKYYGNPSNKLVRLGDLSGYTKVKHINLEDINATDTEIEMIETLLTEGVIL